MEDLIELALAQPGLADDYDAKVTIGTFLEVIAQSEHLGKGVRFRRDILERLDGGDEFMKLYRKRRVSQGRKWWWRQGPSLSTSDRRLP